MYLSIENSAKNRALRFDNLNSIQRIIESFRLAKAEQSNQPQAYQTGDMWKPIVDQKLRTITAALTRGDISLTNEIYSNFFRDDCSTGLHGLHLDVPRHFQGNEINEEIRDIFLQDQVHRLNLWLDLTEETTSIEELVTADFGNPYGFYIDGQFLRTGVFYHHYYATTISRLIRSRQPMSVLEIGGGYGGMAYFLIRDTQNLTYIDIDIPENIALISYYLMANFPHKKIGLYGEFELNSANLKSHDIVLLPNFAIKHLANTDIDLTFNSYSLAEMPRETVIEYFSHINKFTKKYIYHVNHTVDANFTAQNFPVDRNKFQLLYRAPALWNKARNSKMDEFEFLYKLSSPF
jgi:putative sugar O-methyltransferase